MDGKGSINVDEDCRVRVLLKSSDQGVSSEVSKSIRRIMEVVEKYTNFFDLEDEKRAIVRDTVLNQINRLSRVTRSKQTVIFNGDPKNG